MSKFAVGDILAGKYEIKAIIGTGGMGTVYRARQIDLGRDVAIKVPHADALKVEGFLARFSREARTVARLLHDNIVQVYEYQESEDSIYIVMEYVEGHDLKSLIQKPPPDLTVKDLAIILRATGEGLAHAHEAGIVHRDIKPHNVMVQRRARGKWRVKIMDFGIAHLEADANMTMNQEQLTVTGQVIGTPSYMAPEQIRGAGVSARSDIYSFGCVIFFCFTRQTPFQGTGFTVAAAHLSEPPPPIRNKVPVLTEAFEKVVSHCLEKEPDNRPGDAADVAQRLYDSLTPIFARPLAELWPSAREQVDGTDVIQPTAMVGEAKRESSSDADLAETLVDRGPSADRARIPSIPAGSETDATATGSATIGYQDPTVAETAAGEQPARRPVLAPVLLVGGGLLTLLVVGMAIGFALYTSQSGRGPATNDGGEEGTTEVAMPLNGTQQETGESPVDVTPEATEDDGIDEPEPLLLDPADEEQEAVTLPLTPTPAPTPTPEPTPTPDPVERRVANLTQQAASARGLNDLGQLWSQAANDPQFATDERMMELASEIALRIVTEPEMRAIPGGRFTMGSPGATGEVEERPAHNVRLDPYQIALHEVTALEFATFLNDIPADEARRLYSVSPTFNIVHDGAGGRFEPRGGRHLHPANGVSFEAAERYARWLSDLTGERYRLPTEAEWENAAKSGTTARFPWGASDPVARQANYNNPAGGTVAVLEMASGRTSWDLRHMAGNVSEWCQDWYREDAYESGDRDNPVISTQPSGELRPRRVLRGGSFLSMSANDIRTTRRHRLEPGRQEPDVGFRLVRD